MQETIGQRILARRKKSKLTQVELARKLRGVTHAAVSQWESDKTTPNASNLHDLSVLFECSQTWLLHGGDEIDVIPISINGNKIPILTYPQLKEWDSGQSLKQNQGSDYIMTNIDISATGFAFLLKGDAMTPIFFEGDVIIIDPEIEPEPGEFVLALVGERILFRRFKVEGEVSETSFTLVPLNSDYPLISSNSHTTSIIGTMVEHRTYRRKR